VLAGEVINSENHMNVAIAKGDSHGHGWGFQYGARMEDTYAYVAVATTYYGVVAVGYQTLNDAGANVYEMGTFPNGLYMWSNWFDWSWTEYARGIDRTSDGGYIVTGGGERSPAWNSWDVWVLRLDANGDTLWTKLIGDDGMNESSYQIRRITILRSNL